MLYTMPIQLVQASQLPVVRGGKVTLHTLCSSSQTEIILIMKKTLIAFLALAGISSAATTSSSLAYSQYSEALKKGLLFAYSFDNNSATADFMADGITTIGSFTVANGLGTCTGTNPVKLSNSDWSGDFTLSFMFVNGSLSKNTALVSLYADTTTSGRENCIMLTQNNQGYMNLSCLAFGGSAWDHPYNNKKTTAETKHNALTLTWDSSAAQITYYIGSEQVAQATLTSQAIGDTAKHLTFATANGSYNATSATFDNIAMWNRALSASEVKTLTVPEPATAMLSLLVLAGLATRRSRK